MRYFDVIGYYTYKALISSHLRAEVWSWSPVAILPAENHLEVSSMAEYSRVSTLFGFAAYCTSLEVNSYPKGMYIHNQQGRLRRSDACMGVLDSASTSNCC